MKKIFTLLVLGLTLASCSSDDSSPATPSQERHLQVQFDSTNLSEYFIVRNGETTNLNLESMDEAHTVTDDIDVNIGDNIKFYKTNAVSPNPNIYYPSAINTRIVDQDGDVIYQTQAVCESCGELETETFTVE